jgi:hypothetical protein
VLQGQESREETAFDLILSRERPGARFTFYRGLFLKRHNAFQFTPRNIQDMLVYSSFSTRTDSVSSTIVMDTVGRRGVGHTGHVVAYFGF